MACSFSAKLPTNDAGAGYSAVKPLDPSTPDILAVLITNADVQGKPTDIVKFGADNVIAFRVYAGKPDGGITGGTLAIRKSGAAASKAYTRKMDADDDLYDTAHPVKFDLSFNNPSDQDIQAIYPIDIKDDEGVVPPGYGASDSPITVRAKREATVTPTISFVSPGFYTFTITGKVGDTPIAPDNFIVGYNAELIRPAGAPLPADFDTFWSGVKADAAKPLNSQALPDPSFPDLTVYKIRYDGIDGKPAYAWLSLPKSGRGKAPAVLELPPYGGDFTGPNTELPDKGIAVLRFIATAPDWTSGNANADYLMQGIASPKTYVFRTIVGNALRAFDVLANRPEVDPARLGLAGVSQGGGLALMLAGLEKNRVKALVAGSPFPTLIGHSMKAAQDGGYPALRDYQTAHGDADIKTLYYFDTVHFTPLITAQTYLPLGLQDKITPPYASFAAANLIKADHITNVDPNAGHIPQAGLTKGYAWLVDKLK